MKVILFICWITLLCDDMVKALRCYGYDQAGAKMCIPYEDCNNKSITLTCSGDQDACGWQVLVS